MGLSEVNVRLRVARDRILDGRSVRSLGAGRCIQVVQEAHRMLEYIGRCASDLLLLNSCAHFNPSRRLHRRLSNRLLEMTFFEILTQMKPLRFVEVGAFNAETSVAVSKLLRGCAIYAFEFNPSNAVLARELIGHTGASVNLIQKGVSDYEGTIEAHVPQEQGQQPAISKRTSARESGGSLRFEAECTTLDAFFVQGCLESSVATDQTTVLWIDSEGNAFEVLSGARAFLRSTRMIFVEVEDVAVWPGQKLSHDVVELLRQNGFVPVARDVEFGVQYNILFVHYSCLSDHEIRSALLSHNYRCTNFGMSLLSLVLTERLEALYESLGPLKQGVPKGLRQRVRRLLSFSKSGEASGSSV